MRIVAIVAALAALGACTPTAGSGAAGGTGSATPESAGATPSTQPAPNIPIPDSRTPQPAPDTAPPGPPAAHPSGQPAQPASGSRAADSLHVAQLEHEAVAIAKNTGCSRDDQCRNVPVGVKACGGPRYYLKYCTVSTDTTALFRKLAELAAAERAYNKKYQVISTCMMIMPTRPHLDGGVCK